MNERLHKYRQTDMVRLTTLFRALTHFVVGCAAIPTESEPAGYAKSMARDAIRYCDRNGRDAAVDHYSSEDSVHGWW